MFVAVFVASSENRIICRDAVHDGFIASKTSGNTGVVALWSR